MPKAATHDIITVVSGVALAPLLYHGLQQLETAEIATAVGIFDVALFTLAHIVSGYYFSPDLDIDSKIHKRWGPFGVIWLPYRQMVPHRHFWSHGLVIAPLLRLVYLFIVLQLGLFALLMLQVHGVLADFALPKIDTALLFSLMLAHPRATGLVLGGFISGSAAHTISDWLVSAIRGSSR